MTRANPEDDLAIAPSGLLCSRIISVSLPVPPSANKLFRNFAKGRAKTKEYKSWIIGAGWKMRQQLDFPHGLEGPVVVSISVPSNNRRDLDNHAKPLIDLLVRNNVIENDRCKIVRGVTMQWHSGDQVEVTVEPAVLLPS